MSRIWQITLPGSPEIVKNFRVGTYGPIRRPRIPLFKGGESVIRLSLGRRLVNLSPVAQRTNAFTHSGRHYCTAVCTLQLCAGPIAGCSAVLCLCYVDTVAIGAWFVPSWCAQKKQAQKHKTKTNNKKNKKRKTWEQSTFVGIDPEIIISPLATNGWDGLRGGRKYRRYPPK